MLADGRLVSPPCTACSTGVVGKTHPRHCSQSKAVVLFIAPQAPGWLGRLLLTSSATLLSLPSLFPCHLHSPAHGCLGSSRAGSSTVAQWTSPPGSCESVVLSPEAATAHVAEMRAGAACQRAGWQNGGNGSEFSVCILVSTPLCWAISTVAKLMWQRIAAAGRNEGWQERKKPNVFLT